MKGKRSKQYFLSKRASRLEFGMPNLPPVSSKPNGFGVVPTQGHQII